MMWQVLSSLLPALELILTYTNPLSIDIVNLKLTNSAVKQCIELHEPSHHFFSIIQAISTRSPLRIINLPTNYILPVTIQTQIRRDGVLFKQFASVANYVTTFMLHYYNHPFSIHLLQFDCNWNFLFHICERQPFANSILFSRIAKIKKLQFLMEHSISETQWNIPEWEYAFDDDHFTYIYEPLNNDLYFRFSTSDLDWIIQNKYLLLFLLTTHLFSIGNDTMISTPNVLTQHSQLKMYAKDPIILRALNQFIDFDSVDCMLENRDLLYKFAHGKVIEDAIANSSPFYEYLIGHPKWKEYKNDVNFHCVFLKWTNIHTSTCVILANELGINQCTSKETVLKYVRANRNVLELLNEQWRSDKEVILEACRNNSANAFNLATPKLKNDKDVLKAVIQNRYQNLSLFSLFIPYLTSVDQSREWKLEILAINGDLLNECRPWDREMILTALKQNGCAIRFITADDNVKIDKEMALIAVKSNSGAFSMLPLELKEEIIDQVVHWNENLILQIEHPDRQVALQAATSHCYAFHPDFFHDKEFVLEVITKSWFALQKVGSEFRTDESLVSIILQRNGLCLAFVDYHFRSNLEMVLIAVKQNPCAIQYATIELAQNEQVIQAALQAYAIDEMHHLL